jgi:predicted dienelactone hydrolase
MKEFDMDRLRLSQWVALAMFQWISLLLTPSHAQEAGPSPVELAPAKHPVGYRVLQVSAPNARGTTHTMDVALWYPTSSTPQPFQYDFGSHQVGALVAPEGEIAEGKFPLVIYSHGATGGGLSSFFLTQHLASQGYIVAAPDHTDDYAVVRIDSRKVPAQTALYRLGLLKYLQELRSVRLDKEARKFRTQLAYRPQQVTATLDALLKKSPVSGSIDTDRIVLVGHSLGAWTSMLLGGADSRWADPRFKAIVALSGPVNSRVYEDKEIGAVQAPVMLMYGTTEVTQGRGNDRSLLFDRLGKQPVYLVPIEGADHFTFSAGGRKEYATVAAFLERDARRAKIVKYTESFLDATLQDDTAAKEFLREDSQGTLRKNVE